MRQGVQEIASPGKVTVITETRRATALLWPGFLGRVVASGHTSEETVVTRMHFAAAPQRVWEGLQFYEEVRGTAPFPLNMFMPRAVRTEGKKDLAGNEVRCVYESGELMKRITLVDAPHTIEFDVIDQQLGIEGCAVARCGSYRLLAEGDGTELVATTHYASHLNPRWIWRPIERMIMHQLHGRVLKGMHAEICSDGPSGYKG